MERLDDVCQLAGLAVEELDNETEEEREVRERRREQLERFAKDISATCTKKVIGWRAEVKAEREELQAAHDAEQARLASNKVRAQTMSDASGAAGRAKPKKIRTQAEQKNPVLPILRPESGTASDDRLLTVDSCPQTATCHTPAQQLQRSSD